MIRVALLASGLVIVGCGSGPLPPATLDAPGNVCAFCRMAVSPSGLVAQVVAPGEEPQFFDDIGCLAAFLNEHALQSDEAIAYVADHRTRNWVRADRALYTRNPDLETPMNSHLMAHADVPSRDADPLTSRGSAVTFADVFAAATPPRERR